MEDLRTVAPGFPIKDADQSAQSDDRAEYSRLQAAAEHADIIFTTQKVLCVSLASECWPPIMKEL